MQLDRKIETAVGRNAPRHITGMPLYPGRRFMQALAGEKAVVDETVRQIETDKRRKDVFVIDQSPIAPGIGARPDLAPTILLDFEPRPARHQFRPRRRRAGFVAGRLTLAGKGLMP